MHSRIIRGYSRHPTEFYLEHAQEKKTLFDKCNTYWGKWEYPASQTSCILAVKWFSQLSYTSGASPMFNVHLIFMQQKKAQLKLFIFADGVNVFAFTANTAWLHFTTAIPELESKSFRLSVEQEYERLECQVQLMLPFFILLSFCSAFGSKESVASARCISKLIPENCTNEDVKTLLRGSGFTRFPTPQ